MEKFGQGVKSLDEIIKRLKESEREISDANTPITGWQFDPIYLGQ